MKKAQFPGSSTCASIQMVPLNFITPTVALTSPSAFSMLFASVLLLAYTFFHTSITSITSLCVVHSRNIPTMRKLARGRMLEKILGYELFSASLGCAYTYSSRNYLYRSSGS